MTSEFSKGITAKSGTVKSAGSKVSKAGSSGASAQKSSFVSVGGNLSLGLASDQTLMLYQQPQEKR